MAPPEKTEDDTPQTEPTQPTESETAHAEELREDDRAIPDAAADTAFDLPLGKALTSQEASRITAASQTTFLLVGGPVKSGKTTLLATLFHCFQRGRFAGYVFAGSRTLPGFDTRCHLARITSGRTRPETERTHPGDDRKFLHFRLRGEAPGATLRDILLADLSGEHYESAKNSIVECRRLPLIQRADHFVVLIDGAKLIRAEQRQRAKNEAIMLLRCCLDAEQLHLGSLVDVLFSKWDLVEQSKDRQQHVDFVRDVQASIEEGVSPRVARVRFFRVAARPEKGNLELGHGLADAFSAWVEEAPQNIFPRLKKLIEPKGLTEFDRYFRRRLSNLFVEV